MMYRFPWASDNSRQHNLPVDQCSQAQHIEVRQRIAGARRLCAVRIRRLRTRAKLAGEARPAAVEEAELYGVASPQQYR
jgi:hypothetical protein